MKTIDELNTFIPFRDAHILFSTCDSIFCFTDYGLHLLVLFVLLLVSFLFECMWFCMVDLS